LNKKSKGKKNSNLNSWDASNKLNAINKLHAWDEKKKEKTNEKRKKKMMKKSIT